MFITRRRTAVLVGVLSIVLGAVIVHFSLAGAANAPEACLGGGSAVDEAGTEYCVNVRYHGRPITAEELTTRLRGRTPFYSLQIALTATVFDTKAEYEAAIRDFCARDPRHDRLPHCR